MDCWYLNCCPGKRTFNGIMALDIFMLINATRKKLVRLYQSIVSWKGTVLQHSLKLWSDRGTRAESGVWHCYIFPAAVENRNRGGMGTTWNILDFKGYCHFLLLGWDKLRIQISLPFLWWSDNLCVLPCAIPSITAVQVRESSPSTNAQLYYDTRIN